MEPDGLIWATAQIQKKVTRSSELHSKKKGKLNLSSWKRFIRPEAGTVLPTSKKSLVKHTRHYFITS
jgi:hypothetical protein